MPSPIRPRFPPTAQLHARVHDAVQLILRQVLRLPDDTLILDPVHKSTQVVPGTPHQVIVQAPDIPIVTRFHGALQVVLLDRRNLPTR
jgi:hypothetical protein